jgi:hypothetical protein
MTDTIFFRLLDVVNRPSRLSNSIAKSSEGGKTADAYSVEPTSFQQVPGSPFAYWVSDEVRSKFVELPQLGSKGRDAQHGVSTKEDFQFVRAYREAAANTLLDPERGPYGDVIALEEWC